MLEGTGETLVLIHGLSDSLLYWDPIVANLKSDFQILRIDLRGHGGSELGDEVISSDTFVKDLKNLLDNLNIDKVALIGFSIGGAIALEFSTKFPEMVYSIVLMSSFYKVDTYLCDIFYKLKENLKIGFEEFYDFILPMILCPEVIRNNADELEMLKEVSSKSANTEAYIMAIDAFNDFDIEDSFSWINVPTLILAGRYDDITLLNSQKAMNDKIKNSKLFVFDNAKHNLLVGKNIVKIIEIIKKEYK